MKAANSPTTDEVPSPGRRALSPHRKVMYPFQIEDVDAFHAELDATNLAVCTAEQGLGKTLMSLTLADERGYRRVLVLCPAIGRISWAEEIEKWATCPRKLFVLKDGPAAARVAKAGSGAIIVVCTYDLCRTETVRNALRDAGFDFAILDEAQQMRTPTSQRTKAVYAVRDGVLARIRDVMLMSGTLIVSWPRDLWAHLKRFSPERILLDGKPMTFDQFTNHYHVCQRVPNPHSRYGPPLLKIYRAKNTDDLKRRTEGWHRRRRKVDVLKDLPPMSFRTWSVEGTPAERKALKTALADELPAHLVQALDAAGTDEKMQRVMTQIAGSSAHTSKVLRLTGMAKASAVARTLQAELEESDYKMGVFAWNLDVIDVLARDLAEYQPAVIIGGVSTSQRQAAKDRFMTDPACRVFIGQISACGTALTLTAASRVVFVQMSWTPGDNAQAAARFHRIGQTAAVDCRIASLAGTIDTAMSRVLATKTRAAMEVMEDD